MGTFDTLDNKELTSDSITHFGKLKKEEKKSPDKSPNNFSLKKFYVGLQVFLRKLL